MKSSGLMALQWWEPEQKGDKCGGTGGQQEGRSQLCFFCFCLFWFCGGFVLFCFCNIPLTGTSQSWGGDLIPAKGRDPKTFPRPCLLKVSPTSHIATLGLEHLELHPLEVQMTSGPW